MRTAPSPTETSPARAREGARWARAAARRDAFFDWAATPIGAAVLLTLLVAASAVVRWEGRNQWLWIDEGLSAGIAGHPLRELPTLLRQDGSPPLYYALLHVWIRGFGTTEAALHSFSYVFALACVPVAWWAGWSIFGRRTAWFAALLAAFNPFLTYYGREARMYSLVAFLALVAMAAFIRVYALGERRLLPLFAGALTLLLYTHNWSVFFTLGAVLALVPCLALRQHERPMVIRDAVIGFGCAGVLFLPWLPTLLYQVAHTGAPWSKVPTLREAISELDAVLGDERTLVALLLVGGAGIASTISLRRYTDVTEVVTLLVLFTVPIALSWVTSQFEPNWATRYFAMIVGTVLLVGALGLARAGVQGVCALVLILLFWTQPLGRITGARGDLPLAQKSNVKGVVLTLEPDLRPGDLVISTHGEQVPVVRHYLGDDYRYATATGPVADPGIFDWRDVVDRMEAATPEKDLVPLVDRQRVGSRIVLLGAVGALSGDRDPYWFVLFHRRQTQWARTLRADPRLRLVRRVGKPVDPGVPGTSLYGLEFEKVSD